MKSINKEELYYASSEDKELDQIMERDNYNRMISQLTLQEQEIVSLKILSKLSFKEKGNIFFIITIAFSIIFVKHQQKAKKKVSK